jgi:predicted metal-binding protein
MQTLQVCKKRKKTVEQSTNEKEENGGFLLDKLMEVSLLDFLYELWR